VCQYIENSRLQQQLALQAIEYWLACLPVILLIKQSVRYFAHPVDERQDQVDSTLRLSTEVLRGLGTNKPHRKHIARPLPGAIFKGS
jgi:hypothetical protein